VAKERSLHRPEDGKHGAERIRDHALLGTLEPAATVTFTFDGVAVAGRDGEPIIAALLAGGVRTLCTMPRFGEPRGGYCMVGRCIDCQVIVDGVPNMRACMTPVAEGLEVRTQHELGGNDAPESVS
jgi:predicted molibdopterin-dependent oxidoreductase YjgC